MRATDLLRWKRALNEVRFRHEELEIVKEICSTQNGQFGKELREYCAKRNIDLSALIAKRDAKESKLKNLLFYLPSIDLKLSECILQPDLTFLRRTFYP